MYCIFIDVNIFISDFKMANMIQNYAMQERARKENMNRDIELYNQIVHNQPPHERKDVPMLRRLASSKEYQRGRFHQQKKKIIKRKKKKVDPIVFIPTRIEEAPMRRQDRRTLNALNRRRSDRHLVYCISCTVVLLLAACISSIVFWYLYRKDYGGIAPLIVVGPVLGGSAIFLLITLLEVAVRLYQQTARVMDKSLLNIQNLHDVKHWIEPNLVGFGWGHFDMEEEGRTMDEQKLRINKPPIEKFV
ncbi:uncharacterized protein LOC111702379 isoform X1 [Eurytemora carolleeae]|uniref:uncharacterized protein LOC111702379 isoform X1 n=1 Tax=Eurytemora carolleeae TaxID=1294199 RepID=UPI000C7763A3|nr:uncharacterized protein LOC111702379 isoform X1 [Eurytemora carolleeae]|eukprot:XP_023329814.1 uncharacterized protein LOC111702379 isoform X1 [Eurytemora affinis]